MTDELNIVKKISTFNDMVLCMAVSYSLKLLPVIRVIFFTCMPSISLSRFMTIPYCVDLLTRVSKSSTLMYETLFCVVLIPILLLLCRHGNEPIA